jgi:hypothetical protein
VLVVVNDEVKIESRNLLIRNAGVGFSGIAFVSYNLFNFILAHVLWRIARFLGVAAVAIHLLSKYSREEIGLGQCLSCIYKFHFHFHFIAFY